MAAPAKTHPHHVPPVEELPLVVAVKACNAPEVARLLREGADPNTVTHSKKTPVLHVAICRGSASVVQTLLAGGADPNVRNALFWTPLMQAIARCLSQVDPLLAAGAHVRPVNSRRVSARMMAERGGHAALATRLAALEAAEILSNKPPRGRVVCADCGALLHLESRMKEMQRKTLAGHRQENNVYCAEFFRAPFFDTIATDPAYHALAEDRSFAKEVSEAYGVLAAVDRVLRKRPDVAKRVACGALPAITFVDLCCGKSLTSILLALRYPTASVLAVDRLSHELQPHALPASVSYRQADILTSGFQACLIDTMATDGCVGILCGMHLCGNLSLRAIELFRAIPAFAAIVLAPCCLPGKSSGSTVVLDSGSKEAAVQYQFWAHVLRDQVTADSATTHASCQRDLGISSQRNLVIEGVREACAAEEHTILDKP